jgi:sulfite exporter TauE/SafE
MSAVCGQPEGFVAAGFGALFTLGLAGSVHCLGMCGPLSCLATGTGKQGLTAYHLARLASYAGLGALLYILGAPLRLSLSWPWLLALLSLPLLAYALAPWLRAPAFLGRLFVAGQLRVQKLPLAWRGWGLGLLTPLLPCGLLYAAAGYSLAAPNAATASAWMGAFAAGTLPILLAGQLGWRLGGRISRPDLLFKLRRATAFFLALALVAIAWMESNS